MYRLLPNESTSGRDEVQHVRRRLFADFIRSTISGTGSGRCDECPERRVPGTSDVSSIPSVLWILRQLRRHSRLP